MIRQRSSRKSKAGVAADREREGEPLRLTAGERRIASTREPVERRETDRRRDG